jgi:thiol:disulfide interchange protein
MSSIKSLLFVLVSLFVSVQSKAQNDGPKPPVFKISLSKPSAKIGDVVEIRLTSIIPKDFHMYSTNCVCEFGPTNFTASFVKNKTYELVGDLYSIGDQIKNDDIFNCQVGVFYNKAVFGQKVKVLSEEMNIDFSCEGQWCNEEACFPFGNLKPLKFSEKLKVKIEAGSKVLEEIESSKVETDIEPANAEAPVVDTVKPSTSENNTEIDSNDCKDCSYRASGPNDTKPCVNKTFNGKSNNEDDVDYWSLFVLAFISGLIGLLTPCVFPMIPMTVSFFMKDDKKSKLKARLNAMFFGVSIIFIYTVLGTIFAFIFGADAGSVLSTHWIPNTLFFLIFVIFAFSFFGAFEIVLPSSIVNKADKEADKGGYYGAFFMALTLAIVSFSCTGPIVASVLVKSADGAFLRPIIAMFGFGLAFALPFTLFALFPSWLNSLPKSGGWLNSVKVCIGFIELALALKFLSIVDLTYHWHILDREIYLALWIVIFTLMGVYLLGKIKFSHDSDLKFIKVPRLLIVIATFSFVMYMIPGMWGAPLKALAGYLPPMSTQDFDINRSIREANGLEGNICKKPSYSSEFHLPHGLNGYFDYEEAIECGKQLKKPVFIDFTGHGCVNCRLMEEKVWSDPRVLKILKEEYVIASLFVDDKKIKLPESDHFYGRFTQKKVTYLGKKNTEIEICYFGKTAQPLYCLLDAKENLLQQPVGTRVKDKNFDATEFYEFLQEGLKEYKLRNPIK